MDKKKTLILSILGVIVLVIAVVGISYAMYTFTGTGSKENLITTGSVSVDVPSETSTITLDSSYSATDAAGVGNGETLEFSVKSNLKGDAPIKYEVGFDVVESNVPGGLKAKDVNFNLKKGTDTYLLGTATTGVTLASRYANAGTIKDNGGATVISNYLVDSGTLTGEQTFNYVVKAWINEDYNLPTTGSGTCGGTPTVPTTEENCKAIYGIWNGSACALADATACNAAGGTWTDTVAGIHSNETTPSTLTFKIKVVAAG